MFKKLTAKTQYLNASLPENVGGFTKAMGIEPESNETLMKRGAIYAIFDIEGGAGFDTNLVTKVVHDVLHDSYFQSDNISPIQSLEKAIAEVRDKVVQLTNESIRPDTQPPVFSIIAGVLWGNVMYVVQYGNAQSYLVREGEIRPINTISEGAFSAASGVVRDDDVIILCSKGFGKKYPPDKLVSMSIGEEELQPLEACILMKFMVDTSFSQNEVVDFGIPDLPKKKRGFVVFTKIHSWIKTAAQNARIKRLEKKSLSVTSLSGIGDKGNRIKADRPISSLTSGGIKLRRGRNMLRATLFQPGVLIILVALALGVAIVVTVMSGRATKPVTINKANSQTEGMPKAVNESTETSGAVNGASTSEAGVFYDIKIADAKAEPNGLVVFNNTVIATDSKNGTIYASNINTAKFEPLANTFTGIANPINIGGELGFTDAQGYKVYDLAQNKVIEDYKQTGLGVTAAYLNYIYSVAGDKLLRYSKQENALSETLWTQNADFSGAKSIAVAYNIYAVTSDGRVVRYTTGTKDSWQLSGEHAALNGPVQVVADVDYKYEYIADAGNGRVAVFDETGKFIKEYTGEKPESWKGMRAISVSPDEKLLFVLIGSRVYKVEL